jgi:hypothetical protein
MNEYLQMPSGAEGLTLGFVGRRGTRLAKTTVAVSMAEKHGEDDIVLNFG